MMVAARDDNGTEPPPRSTPTMAIAAPILTKRPEIEAACERAGVRRLWVFGSAVRGEWHESSSDIDFLVELDPKRPLPDQFFGLYRELKSIFGREIDLVSIGGVKNPYFLEGLEQTRVPVYAAA
jgi:predicted nucleotidyltransferase